MRNLQQTITPPKFNIAPEKFWLEDEPFLLGLGNFSGLLLLNFGRVLDDFGLKPNTIFKKIHQEICVCQAGRKS